MSSIILGSTKYNMKHLHHIIPRHAGGTDDPSNLVELTPEEHAEAHRKLWEEHGRWQDYCAWMGLAKYSTNKEHIKLVIQESNRARKGMKYNRIKTGNYNRKGANNPCARQYIVEHPDGTKENVKALKVWCEERELNYNTFHAQCIGRGKSHKGYKAVKD